MNLQFPKYYYEHGSKFEKKMYIENIYLQPK